MNINLGISVMLFAALSACGGGSGGGSSNAAAPVSVMFSDAPVENAAKVAITVDTITFSPVNGDDIVVETFTSDELGIVDADTFTIDLLEVQGNDNRLVIDSVDLPPGDYKNARIKVIDEDVNFSYVEELDSGLQKPIKVPSDELKLGRFTVTDVSTQTFVVEFGLRQSLVYNPGPPGKDRYILKPRGVRIVDMEAAATIFGSVRFSTLHDLTPCNSKPDTQVGNVAYLYAGKGLDSNLLGDDFIRANDAGPGEDFDPNVADDIIAPVVSVKIEGGDVNGYMFSYLMGGDYTLAISCVADGDDPITYDNIQIPAPGTELIELSLGAGETFICDFPLVNGACANLTP